jgi:sugar phosphate isomerase/epimerase
MNLSFSNIAWSPEYDEEMYTFLSNNGYTGLEIAPTRLFPDRPYEYITEVQSFTKNLFKKYGLTISSMQSIWYGRNENIFGSDKDRQSIIEYTCKAINFAVAASCKNLVFGCPKNRNIPGGLDSMKAHKIAEEFFQEIGKYAQKSGIIISLEPNPVIYGTNFINSTEEAFTYAKKIDGIMVNIDFGTIIQNNENLQTVNDNIKLVNHVHISEPNLERIEHRDLHKDLVQLLLRNEYDRYVSIEMKKTEDITIVKRTALYIKDLFL